MIKSLTLLVTISLAACAASTPKPVEPPPVAVQTNVWDNKNAGEQCLEAAVAVCSKVAACDGDTDSCANDLGSYCAGVKRVVDSATVYNVCIPQIEQSTCSDPFPTACQGLFE